MKKRIKQLILLSGDVTVLYLSLYIALSARYLKLPNSDFFLNHFWIFTMAFILWILIFYIFNLYSLVKVNDRNYFIKTGLNAIFISFLFSALIFYLHNDESISPKTILLIQTIISAILFILWRLTFSIILKKYLPKQNIAFLNLNNESKEIIKKILNNPQLGYRVSFAVDDKTDNYMNIAIFSPQEDIKQLIKKYHPNTIVFPNNVGNDLTMRENLFSCLSFRLNFFSLAHFYEKIIGKIPVEAINQMWFLENINEGEKNLLNSIKRFYDFVFSAIILIATFPFWILIGIAIKTNSKGPIFFTQTRLGQNGRLFQIVKFRTMIIYNNNHELTKKDDKRITKIGKFLRSSRIDEIPQVLNILKGEMSLIGPRPERPELVKNLEKEIPFYNERLLVKPGVTGWDQVSGEYHSPNTEDSLKKIQYDLFYIKNRSVYLDISIMLKTIATIIGRNGR